MRYFKVNADGPLKEGATVLWKFQGHEPLTLYVHQVIENTMIKFLWGQSHVCFSFRDLGEDRTEVAIEATGWNADQAGLNDSYSECDGWTEFLLLLKLHLENKLLTDKEMPHVL